ncbi:mucin-2-like, partial [Musca vetustissima]|uniref:mucin-2-like n=1 Tax=Musca vetustissima TaxID=27455 RepID=UPI002AB5EED6
MKLYVQLSLLWIASFQLYEAVFVSELCRNRQFGFKVQDPLDCHGFYVCLGDIGQFSLDCGREYRFNETTQRCTLGKCPPCPCAVTDGIPQITGFLPMIIYPLQNNPIIYGFGTNVAPCNSAAQSTSLQNSSSDLPMTLQKGSDKVDSVRAKSDLLSNKTRILMKKLTSKKKAPDTSFICMNKTDGSFERDPNNCSLYYICYDNNAYTQECPGILQFDPSDNMCNMPEIVKCIPVETKDTTTKEIHTNTSTNPIAQTVSYSTNGFTTTSPIETVMTSPDSVSKTTTLWPTTPGADNTTLNPRHETTTLTILETTYTRPLRSRSIDYGSTESSTTRTTIQDSTNYLTTDRTEYTTETFPRSFVPTTNPVETSTISSATTESETNTGEPNSSNLRRFKASLNFNIPMQYTTVFESQTNTYLLNTDFRTQATLDSTDQTTIMTPLNFDTDTTLKETSFTTVTFETTEKALSTDLYQSTITTINSFKEIKDESNGHITNIGESGIPTYDVKTATTAEYEDFTNESTESTTTDASTGEHVTTPPPSSKQTAILPIAKIVHQGSDLKEMVGIFTTTTTMQPIISTTDIITELTTPTNILLPQTTDDFESQTTTAYPSTDVKTKATFESIDETTANLSTDTTIKEKRFTTLFFSTTDPEHSIITALKEISDDPKGHFTAEYIAESNIPSHNARSATTVDYTDITESTTSDTITEKLVVTTQPDTDQTTIRRLAKLVGQDSDLKETPAASVTTTMQTIASTSEIITDRTVPNESTIYSTTYGVTETWELQSTKTLVNSLPSQKIKHILPDLQTDSTIQTTTIIEKDNRFFVSGTTVESPLTTVETTTPTEETTQSYLPTFTTVATVTITQLSSATFFEGSTTTWTETYTSTVTSDTKVTTTIIPTDVSTITEATAPSDLPTETLSTLTSAEISKEISTTPPTTETYFSTKGSELATDSTVTIVETTEITFTVDTTTSSATEINSTTIATLTPENTTSLSIQSTTTVADLTPTTTYISTDSPPPLLTNTITIQSTTTVADLTPTTTYISTDSPPPLLTNTITTESPSKTELPTELTKTPDHTPPTTYILTNSPTPLPTNTKTPERPNETKLPTELTTATPATTHIHSEGPNQTKPQTELTTATTSTAVPICLNQPNGKFVRDPNDCNKFYTCFQNLSYLQICPAGLYFDTVLNVCNYRHMVNCPVTTPSTSTPNPTPTHSPKPEDCYRLPGGTFVRDPSDCNVYYVCLNGRAIKLQCPRGQYFDNERFV